MKRPKVKMQSAGARELLRSGAVQKDLTARTNRIASSAGAGFEAQVTVGRSRALGFVAAMTPEAFQAESDNRALTRAVDAGR